MFSITTNKETIESFSCHVFASPMLSALVCPWFTPNCSHFTIAETYRLKNYSVDFYFTKTETSSMYTASILTTFTLSLTFMITTIKKPYSSAPYR